MGLRNYDGVGFVSKNVKTAKERLSHELRVSGVLTVMGALRERKAALATREGPGTSEGDNKKSV